GLGEPSERLRPRAGTQRRCAGRDRWGAQRGRRALRSFKLEVVNPREKSSLWLAVISRAGAGTEGPVPKSFKSSDATSPPPRAITQDGFSIAQSTGFLQLSTKLDELDAMLGGFVRADENYRDVSSITLC